MEYLFYLLEILKRGLTNVTFWNFTAIIVAGAFGGLLSALHLNDGKLSPPEKIKITGLGKKQLYLGFWTDIILGAGAGLIATIPLDLQFPKCVYVAMIAGFGGGNFIAKQAKDTEKERVIANNDLPTIGSVQPKQDEDGLYEIELDTGSEGDDSNEIKN